MVIAEARIPEPAWISKIAFEDYKGDIMRTGEYAQACTALQLNKAIPVMIEIRDKQKELVGGMNALREDFLDELLGLRGDLITRSDPENY